MQFSVSQVRPVNANSLSHVLIHYCIETHSDVPRQVYLSIGPRQVNANAASAYLDVWLH